MAPTYVDLESSETSSPRLEIDEFIQDNAMTNLFLLALEALMAKKYSIHWWSFYYIAKIHGLPAQAWDGVFSGDKKASASTGYCSHGSGLFPTWHRVYVAMMEQAISDKVREIAASFTTSEAKQKYQEAAKRFRLPYWDPLMPRNPDNPSMWSAQFGLPKILQVDEVTVWRPEAPNTPDTLANPLHHYDFPDPEEYLEGNPPSLAMQKRLKDKMGDNAAERTLRRGNLTAYIQSQVSGIADGLYQLINIKKSWDQFSNHAARSRGSVTQSLESWHDNIHTIVGGHMNSTSYAAFDPIFWLHHCNVDRLFALYQAMWPNLDYAAPVPLDESTFVATAGASEGEANPLYPFRRPPNSDKRKYWVSSDRPIKDYFKVGYVIPGRTMLQSQMDIDKYMQTTQSLYSWISTEGRKRGEARPPNLGYPKVLSRVEALQKAGTRRNLPTRVMAMATQELPEQQSIIEQTPQAAAADNPGHLTAEAKESAGAATGAEVENGSKNVSAKGAVTDGNTMRTWDVNVHVPKFAFNGSFTVDVFFGKVNDNEPENYMLEANHAGFTGIFASSRDDECGNCETQQAQDILYGDIVPLTPALMRYLRDNEREDGPPRDGRVLESLEPQHVIPFLEKNLEWRVTAVSSGLKDAQQVAESGLSMVVSDRVFHYATDNNPSGSYDEPTLHPEITRGKAGGAPVEA